MAHTIDRVLITEATVIENQTTETAEAAPALRSSRTGVLTLGGIVLLLVGLSATVGGRPAMDRAAAMTGSTLSALTGANERADAGEATLAEPGSDGRSQSMTLGATNPAFATSHPGIAILSTPTSTEPQDTDEQSSGGHLVRDIALLVGISLVLIDLAIDRFHPGRRQQDPGA